MTKKKTSSKPYCNGTYTEAKFNQFIRSALRRARWPVKYKALQEAFVENGINPETGRKCKLHRCEGCSELFPASKVDIDHIDPVVPLDGKWGRKTRFLGINWNEYMERLFCELDGYQVLCKNGCHAAKTEQERAKRREAKK